jgi:hypothetical protein
MANVSIPKDEDTRQVAASPTRVMPIRQLISAVMLMGVASACSTSAVAPHTTSTISSAMRTKAAAELAGVMMPPPPGWVAQAPFLGPGSNSCRAWGPGGLPTTGWLISEARSWREPQPPPRGMTPVPQLQVCLSAYDTPSDAGAAIRRYRHDVATYEHQGTPPSSIPQPVSTTGLVGAIAYYVDFATSGYESVTIARGAIVAQLDVGCRPTGEDCDLAMQFAQQQLRLLLN